MPTLRISQRNWRWSHQRVIRFLVICSYGYGALQTTDGWSWLCTGSSDTTLKLWKGTTCVHTFSGHSGVALFPFLNFSIAVQEQEITALTRNCPKLLRFSCCLFQQALNFCMSPCIFFLCGLCQGSFMNRLLRVGAFSNALKSDLNLHVAPQIRCEAWHWCPTLVFCQPLMMGNFLFTVHSRCVHSFLRLNLGNTYFNEKSECQVSHCQDILN
jgi:hypothetical protein